MKDYYKINEIARLYGIGVDSLRYYEKLGILKPRRDTNGYRLYNLKDMYKLNVIRDLRRLDFSMQQIKDYLEGQTVDHTLALLRQEQALVQAQIQELQTKARLLQRRIAALTEARSIVPGAITPDSKFSLDSCRCVGACGLAPVMMINDEVFGRMTPEQVPVILEDYARKGGVPV